MEIKEIVKFNSWWEINKVREDLLKPYKRYLFKELVKFIDDRQIILIHGLRRVGKTVLLYQLIDYLLEKGIKPKNILYFSFDEEVYDLKEVIETYEREILNKDISNAGRIYLFLDEIQKVKDWENKIKVYYDLYPNIKIFLSGSASLILSKKAKESLAGRIYEFLLKPLTFKEFLEIKGINVEFENIKIVNKKILNLFFEYIKKWGFPEMVNEEDDKKIENYIKNSVIERILYRDLPKEFGKIDLDFLDLLAKFVLKNPGMILNIENLSRDFKKNKRTIKNYLKYLEYSLIIKPLLNFRISIMASSRKNKKLYPYTPSLSISLGYKDGKIFENVLISELDIKYYYRKGNKEIDFILLKGNKIIPIEVKNKIDERKIKKYYKLLNKLNINKGLILTLEDFYNYKDKIFVYPIWVFLLFKEKILSEILS